MEKNREPDLSESDCSDDQDNSQIIIPEDLSLDKILEYSKKNNFPKKKFNINSKEKLYSPIWHFFEINYEHARQSDVIPICKVILLQFENIFLFFLLLKLLVLAFT